jgi:hypothetical protein
MGVRAKLDRQGRLPVHWVEQLLGRADLRGRPIRGEQPQRSDRNIRHQLSVPLKHNLPQEPRPGKSKAVLVVGGVSERCWQWIDRGADAAGDSGGDCAAGGPLDRRGRRGITCRNALGCHQIVQPIEPHAHSVVMRDPPKC